MNTYGRAALALGVSGVMAITGTAGAAHADSGKQTGGWKVVASGSLPGTAMLNGVTASDAWHAWAVGSKRYPAQADGDGVVQAWNGRTWRTVAGTPPVAEYAAVSARNARDVWAVGRDAAFDPAVVHFDGRRWSRVSTRGLPAGQGPDGVATAGGRTWVVSGTDVFVRTAKGWSGTRLADPARDGALQAVRARGPNDVWVVGVDHREGTQGQPFPNRPTR